MKPFLSIVGTESVFLYLYIRFNIDIILRNLDKIKKIFLHCVVNTLIFYAIQLDLPAKPLNRMGNL